MSSARNEMILARIKNELLRKAAGECLEVAEIFNTSKAEIERSDHYTPKGREQALTNLLANECPARRA